MRGLFAIRMVSCTLLLASSAAAVVWIVFPPPKTRSRVLFISGKPSPESQQLLDGVRAAAEEFGVDLTVTALGSAAEACQQARLLDEVDDSAFDGVIVCPMDPRALNRSVDALVGRMPVVACGVDAEDSKRTAFVGPGAVASGHVAARLVRSLLPDGGQIGVLLDSDEPGHRQRLDSLIADLHSGRSGGTRASWTIAAAQGIDPQSNRVAGAVRRLLAEHPEVTCLACFAGALGDAAASVLAEHSRRVKVVVFEPAQATWESLAAGRVDGVIADDSFAIGHRAMRQLEFLFRADPSQHPIPGKAAVFLPPHAVTRETLAAFQACHARRRSALVN